MSARVDTLLRARSFRWGVNTGLSFVVNLGLTIFLHESLGVTTSVAYAVALTTVFFMNFVLFHYYVFSQHEPKPLGQLFATYAASAIGFRLGEYAAFLLIHALVGLQYMLAIILVQGASFVLKYFFYGRVVFRERSRNTGTGVD